MKQIELHRKAQRLGFAFLPVISLSLTLISNENLLSSPNLLKMHPEPYRSLPHCHTHGPSSISSMNYCESLQGVFLFAGIAPDPPKASRLTLHKGQVFTVSEDPPGPALPAASLSDLSSC